MECTCGRIIYTEIINPKTGKRVPDGEIGELVITTLEKKVHLSFVTEHMTLQELSLENVKGLKYPRIDTIIGRSDDMVKVKALLSTLHDLMKFFLKLME